MGANNRIDIIQADITSLEVDAIVNAANTRLLGGSGVDGAIHAAAGPQLFEECKLLGGCKTGEARLTKGYNLPARFVIHAVGPIWRGGYLNEDELLASAYKNSLLLAKENQFSSLAFPNISTGIFGYPKVSAARVALRTVKSFLEKNTYPKNVIFVCFDDETFSIYKALTA